MSIIKDIFWLLFAALIGYILYKVYQAVASASGSVSAAAGSIGSGTTSIAQDVASAGAAIGGFVSNPLANLGIGGGSSGNTDTLASMALNSPVQDNWLNPSLPADNSTTDLGGGWNLVGNP